MNPRRTAQQPRPSPEHPARPQSKEADAEWLEQMRCRERFQDELMKAWGFKPWKRVDRRNRPLRTKRAWVSFRARLREHDIVKMRCKQGLTFREIGKRLGISHVSAWRRFEWAMETIRMEEEYRDRCLAEIERTFAEIDRLMPELESLPFEEQDRILRGTGLLPD